MNATALTVIIPIHHRSPMLLSLPNPPIVTATCLRTPTLKLLLEQQRNIPTPLPTSRIILLFAPQRRNSSVEVPPAIRKCHIRVTLLDNLRRVKQLPHDLRLHCIGRRIGELGVRVQDGKDEVGADGKLEPSAFDGDAGADGEIEEFVRFGVGHFGHAAH